MKEYLCTVGDSFEGISYKLTGGYDLVPELIRLNDSYRRTYIFKGGEKIEIPEDTRAATSTNSLPPWRR